MKQVVENVIWFLSIIVLGIMAMVFLVMVGVTIGVFG